MLAVAANRVVIRHPATRGVAIVSETAVASWEKRGWIVLDADAPKPVVLEAAEKLGVEVNPDDTRSTIVSELTPDPDPDDTED